MHKFADFVISNPRLVTFFIFLLVIAAIFPASKIRTDFDLENFYPKTDPTVQSYRLLEDEFGRDDNVIMVGFKSDSLFTVSGLLDLKAIVDTLETIPNVTEVQSIWSAEEMVNLNGTLKFDPFLDVDSLQSNLNTIKQRITSDSFTGGFLVDKAGTTTAFFLEIHEENNTYETRNEIIDRLQSTLSNYPSKDFKITGIPFFRNQYVNILNEEVIFYISFSSVLIILLLWYLYRSISGVLIPMFIVWFTVLFTVAVITLSGGYLEIMSSTIAPILLCVGVADSIHMISKFDDAVQNDFKKRKAIIEMILTLGSATFLTSITTAIGFGTLLTSSVVPMKRFGIYTAVGVLIAYTITILFLPAILRITSIKKVFRETGGKLYPWIGDKLLKVSAFNRRHYKTISLSSLLICFIVGIGIYQLQVNGRVFDDVSRDSELIKDSNFFSENLAPAFPLEFVIDTRESEGITDPELIQKIDALQQHLLSYPEIKRATSFSTLLKELHQVMSPEEAAQYPLPVDQNLIAQYLLLLEITDNDILQSVTDFDYQKLRIAAQTEDAGSRRINEIRDSIDVYLSQNFNNEEITVTGSTVLSANLVGKMVYSLASSIGLAFICISILMAFLFKDLKMVIISLIPNIMPLVLIAGIMGYLGVDIKPSTAVIFTIAFGIAVDDTIHYLARFRIELKRGLSFQDALEITTQKTGRAIIITSMILLLGFGTLITSEFTSTTLMGILISSTIFFAVIADLVVLPSLFYWLKPSLKGINIK
ncbi:MAG: MMPL family transporter [Balneola sp.]|jgi:predicted RND superfamily exporter protein